MSTNESLERDEMVIGITPILCGCIATAKPLYIPLNYQRLAIDLDVIEAHKARWPG